MDAKTWQIVKGWLDVAELPAAERDAYLARHCPDPELRREVLALLADPASISRVVESAALVSGTRIGPYHIGEAIGAGGMGEVYRARDTRLGREVAIKVVPALFAEDRDRLARFDREARLLASLNHPNIAQIYGLEEADGRRAIVMELVEGETLAERIARGPVPINDALAIARQICDALEAAHEHGIIHRDLKPANVKVRPDGTVKVLDFGLAAVQDVGDPSSVETMPPTVTAQATRAGVILGTVAYMSPEQARGKPTDRRADIWAFGAVLYEMLTGRRAFGGDEISDTLAAVLKEEPDWTALPPEVPAPVRQLLRRCLEKDVTRRMRDIGDVRLELSEAIHQPSREVSSSAPPAIRSVRLWQGVAALMALLVVSTVMIGRWKLQSRTGGPLVRFEIALPDGANPRGDFVSVSPDGGKVVVAAPGQGLWMRDLSSREWRRLPGTESAVSSAFWSPDSRYLAFGVQDQLKKLDTFGGPPQTLCTIPGGDAEGSGSWSRDGVIIFGSWGGGAGGPVWKVSQAGGAATPLTEVDTSKGELYHTWPVFLEDGKHFLYFRSGPRTSRASTPARSTPSRRTSRGTGSLPVSSPRPTPTAIFSSCPGRGYGGRRR